VIDLDRQIEAYAEQLDYTVPPAAELWDRRRRGQTPLRARPRWWAAAMVALGAAAVVLIAVGVVAINRGDRPVADGVSVVGSAVPPGSTTGTAATPDILRFELASPVPAFDTGEPEMWDWPYVSPGVVVYQDGAYHMLRNGFGDEKRTGVGYGASDNGVAWETAGREPVLTLDGGQVHTGLVTPDGTWVVYFDSVMERGDDQKRRTIGRASASGPEGPWTIDNDPVLEPGPIGDWDGSSVLQPAVVASGDGYLMFYVGGGSGGYAIGLATSSDGVSWTKEERPVLAPEADWEGSELTRPDVVVTAEGMVMLYGNSSGSNRGIATSTDGRTWTRFPGNPMLTTADVPRASMETGEMIYHDGKYLLYLENGGAVSSTNIAVLTRDLPILIR